MIFVDFCPVSDAFAGVDFNRLGNGVALDLSVVSAVVVRSIWDVEVVCNRFFVGFFVGMLVKSTNS